MVEDDVDDTATVLELLKPFCRFHLFPATAAGAAYPGHDAASRAGSIRSLLNVSLYFYIVKVDILQG